MLRRCNSRRREKGIIKLHTIVNGKKVIEKIDPKKTYSDEISPKKNRSINKKKTIRKIKSKKVKLYNNESLLLDETYENIEEVDWLSEHITTDSEDFLSPESYSDTNLSDEPININKNVFKKRLYIERSAQKIAIVKQ